LHLLPTLLPTLLLTLLPTLLPTLPFTLLPTAATAATATHRCHRYPLLPPLPTAAIATPFASLLPSLPMAASTRRQGRVNADAAAAASRRRSRRRSPSPHVSRSRSPAPPPPPPPGPPPPSGAPLGGAGPEQTVETPATLAMRQRIKDVRQANMERELEQELRRLEAQSTALDQSGNNPVVGGTTSQTSGTIPPSDPRIQTMVSRYPFIDTTQLALIFKNEFRAVNIFKLVNDHIPNSLNKQGLRLSRSGELRAHDDDATQQDLKGMVPFIRCLGVYNQCLIEAANDQLRHPLQASLAWYVDYLLELHLHYTFESLRTFHFHFHEIRMIKGVNDPDGWYNAGGELAGRALVKKTPAIASQTGYQSQGARKQSYGPRPEGGSTLPPVCNKFNAGSCTYSGCTYQHICSGCGGTHAAINCKTSNPNSQPVGRK